MKSKKILMQRIHRLFLITFASVLMSGCGTTRVVFVNQESELVRTGPKVTGKVYYWDGEEWELSANKVTLPEGAYVGFLSKEKDEEDE